MCDLPLAVAEHNGVFESIGGSDQPPQSLALLMWIAACGNEKLRDCCGSRGGFVNFNTYRIVQEGVGNALNFRRHGRGEEKSLPRKRHELTDALDIRDKTHVEHAVGLIDDQKFAAREE